MVLKKIDNILLMLGKEIILNKESLIFYHSSPYKYEYINNLGNWFSPIKIKYKTYKNIFTQDTPLWNDGYDFRFINNKPLKLLSITTYTNDISYTKLRSMINIINENIKDLEVEYEKDENIEQETQIQFLLGQENDPEYLLAYYLSKYSSYDGWITDASYLGFCMLSKPALKKLRLLSVTEPLNENNIIIYHTHKQWKEQFI